MEFTILRPTGGHQSDQCQRSARSRAYEDLWRSVSLQSDDPAGLWRTDLAAELSREDLIVLQVDLKHRSMPVEHVGEQVTEIVGFQLQGHDLAQFDFLSHTEKVWTERAEFFQLPCGKFEVAEIQVAGGLNKSCALTMLPLIGVDGPKRLVVLVEELDLLDYPLLDERKLLGRSLYHVMIDL